MPEPMELSPLTSPETETTEDEGQVEGQDNEKTASEPAHSLPTTELPSIDLQSLEPDGAGAGRLGNKPEARERATSGQPAPPPAVRKLNPAEARKILQEMADSEPPG